MLKFSLVWTFFAIISFQVFAEVAKNPSQVRPILIGNTVPTAELQTIGGQAVGLAEKLKSKKSIVIFYRGGWCPYCNTQLQELRQITTKLQKLGYQLIAISPDRPEELKASKEKFTLGYELLSDSRAKAAEAFGVAFKVDDDTLAKYKEYGIDLAKASGHKHSILPVPAVFIFNDEGHVVFQYVNPDYKVRLKKEVLLSAARAYAD